MAIGTPDGTDLAPAPDPASVGGGQPRAGVGDAGTPDPGAGTPEHIALAEDSLIRLPGADTNVSVKDFLASQVSKADHDTLQTKVSTLQNAEQLVARAEAVQKARQAGQQPPAQPGQQPAAPPDFAASFRDKQFISGKDLEEIGNALRSGDIEPLYKWGGAVNQLLTQLSEQSKTQSGRIESFETSRAATQQEAAVNAATTTALKGAGVDLGLDHFGPVADALRDFATNVYFAWSPAEGQTRAQYDAAFPDLFSTALESQRTAFRQLERILATEKRKARIPGQGGNASPGGQAEDVFLSNREIARNHFAHRGATT